MEKDNDLFILIVLVLATIIAFTFPFNLNASPLEKWMDCFTERGFVYCKVDEIPPAENEPYGVPMSVYVEVGKASTFKATSVSLAGIDAIKRHEGFLPRKKWDYKQYSIGYGTAVPASWNKAITRNQAHVLLMDYVKNHIQPFMRENIRVNLSQNQYDAIASFCFNVGIEACRRSTLVRHVNNSNFKMAGVEFQRWVYAGGKVNYGLVKRREEERRLFAER